MKFRVLGFLVMFLVLVSPVLADQPRTMFSAPTNADLMKYPVLKYGGLTPRLAAEMGLHPETIKEPTVVENHFRELVDKDGRMVREILPKGTVVYANASGEPIYKADCANRIAVVKPCPVCPPASPAVKAQATTATTTAAAKTSRGFWEDNFWDLLLALVMLAAIMALVWLILYAIYRLVRRFAEPTPSVTPTSDPDPERKFIAFYAGSPAPTKVNFSGYRQVSIAEEAGKTTLTFS